MRRLLPCQSQKAASCRLGSITVGPAAVQAAIVWFFADEVPTSRMDHIGSLAVVSSKQQEPQIAIDSRLFDSFGFSRISPLESS